MDVRVARIREACDGCSTQIMGKENLSAAFHRLSFRFLTTKAVYSLPPALLLVFSSFQGGSPGGANVLHEGTANTDPPCAPAGYCTFVSRRIGVTTARNRHPFW